MKKYTNRDFIIYLPLVIALSVILGLFFGMQLGSNQSVSNILFSQPEIDKFSVLMSKVEQNYVDSVSRKDMIEKAIPAFLKQLDPHSVYIPAKDYQTVQDPMEGNFEGIGIQFSLQEDTILVVKTIAGGPSEKVGVLAGDKIITINDSLFAGQGIDQDDVVRNLKGPKGTKVKIGVKREGIKELLEFEITRDKIPLHSVEVAYMLTKDIGYIKVDRFARPTYEEFLTGIQKLKRQGMKKIVVDLRSNSGGYLGVATEMIDEFLDAGELIVYTQGRTRARQDYKATDRGLCHHNELVVLIDSWSASASEIFAGAIQDNDRGIIIGQRSFGKGLVQETLVFPDSSMVRLTTARYYTPTGRSIQKPYGDGKYDREIYDRFLHGEMLSRDSIQLPDSLKFTTPKGKVVYGGGGIMPDIFIPNDTSYYSDYFDSIIQKGLIYRFALRYTNQHREDLEPFKSHEALTGYLDEIHIFEEFMDYAKSEGVEIKKEGVGRSRTEIDIRLKAYIARNILNQEEFYPIIHQSDQVLKKAIEVLSN